MATAQGHSHERRHLPDRRSDSTARSGSRARMGAMDWIAMLLLAIGGINWGLVGLMELDLVATLFGEMSTISRAIYVSVGLSALYTLYTGAKMSKR